MSSAGTIEVAIKATGTSQFAAQVAAAVAKLEQMGEATGKAGTVTDAAAEKLEKLAKGFIGVSTAMGMFHLAEQAAEASKAITVFEGLGGSLQHLRDATLGMISDAELAKKANLAGTMGINAESFEKLAVIAKGAAAKTGQSMAFMFDSIITGTARQSKMILDNLGIMVNVEKANKDYAATLHKTATTLTDAEQRQAFMNAVFKEGGQVLEELERTGVSLISPYSQLHATTENLELAMGKGLMPAAQGVMDIISALIPTTDNLEAAFKTLSFMLLGAAESIVLAWSGFLTILGETISKIGKIAGMDLELQVDTGPLAAAFTLADKLHKLREGMFADEGGGGRGGLGKTTPAGPASAKGHGEVVSDMFLLDMNNDLKILDGQYHRFAEAHGRWFEASGDFAMKMAEKSTDPRKKKILEDELTGIKDASNERLKAEIDMSLDVVSASRDAAEQFRHNTRMAGIQAEKSFIAAFTELDFETMGREGLRVLATKFAGEMPGLASKVSAQLKEAAGSLRGMGGLGGIIGKGADLLGNLFGSKTFEDVIGKVATKLPEGLSNITNLFGDVAKGMASKLGPVISTGVSIVQGIVSALQEIGNAAAEAVQTFGKETLGRFVQTAVGGTKLGSAMGAAQQAGGAVAGTAGAFGALAGPLGVILGPLFALLAAPLPALGAAFLDLSTKTKSFAQFQSVLEGAMDRVVVALEPFWQSLFPLAGTVDALMSVMIPFVAAIANNEAAARLAFMAFKNVAVMAANAAIALANMSNFFALGTQKFADGFLPIAAALDHFVNLTLPSFEDAVLNAGIFLLDAVRALANNLGVLTDGFRQAIDNAVQGLKDVKDATRPTSNMEEAFQQLAHAARAAQIDVSGMVDARNQLIGLTYEEADARARALQVEREVSETLQNVPSGYKVALARFEAQDPMMGGTPNPASGAGDHLMNNFTIHVDNLVVQSNDPEEVLNVLQSRMEREAFVATGSTVASRAQRWNGRR